MRYLVWFSGGTDSVFVSWYLKQQWNEVLPVNLKNTKEKNKCCSLPTELLNITNFLDLPLKIVDATEDFKKFVIQNFIENYSSWKTPNPCINCNENVRFQILDKIRQELNYDFISTGHYVKKLEVMKIVSKRSEENSEEVRRENNSQIFTYPNKSWDSVKSWYPVFYTFAIPEDKFKDQTYMLYRLLKYQNIVKHLDFPIANFKKSEIKEILKKNNIPINTEQESQNICFIPDDDYPRFIKQNKTINFPTWKILDINWNYLWEHKGLIYYTIWQRKGLNLNTNEKKYVVDLDWKNNILIVWDDKDLFKKEVKVIEKNILMLPEQIDYSKNVLSYLKETWWIEKVYGKIRYKGKLEQVEAIEQDKVIFKNEVRAITRGQHLVLYWEKNGEIFVIWGGEIG